MVRNWGVRAEKMRENGNDSDGGGERIDTVMDRERLKRTVRMAAERCTLQRGVS